VPEHPTLGGWLEAAAKALKLAAIERPRAESRLLASLALDLEPEAVFAGPERPLSHGELQQLDSLLARRTAHEPMAYIRGETEFHGRNFRVQPGILIPRPETELTVEKALEFIDDNDISTATVLDLGTGSGCILLTLLAERQSLAGIGIDISETAVRVAGENARRLRVDDRLHLVRGDWADAIAGPVDIVVSNPPYIERQDLQTLMPDVRMFEPHTALDGGDDGLDAYRRILSALPGLLKPGGRAFLEIGKGQLEALRSLAQLHGVELTADNDLAGIPRCISLWRGD
jgi:release factor glutamine methyltransferase